jgi:hypothetical protein
MEWVRSELRDTVGEWARNTDWGLVATVAGFILLVPLSWLTLRVNPSLLTVYERAVRAAAVMRPESGVPLRTIDPTAAQVRVANFATQPPENPLRWDAWVSLPDELKGRCAGASDATLALQQILGLPPDPRPRAVYELSVPREKVLRPCISGSDPATPTCLPVFAAAPLHGEEEATPQKFADLPPDKKDATYANLNNNYIALQKAYDDLRLASEQMWKSYHGKGPGFPFTGMGWSYDWGPAANTHIGVSEFVVPKNTAIKIEAVTPPSAFCGTEK